MKFIHLLKKYLTGSIAVKVSKKDILQFPKIAPWMTILILTLGLFQDETAIIPICLTLIAICIFFGFFYYKVFKKEKPKTEEESIKDILAIGFNKQELINKDVLKKEEEQEEEELKVDLDKYYDFLNNVDYDEKETTNDIDDIVELESCDCNDNCPCKDVEEDMEEDIKPSMNNTKGEIITYLESKGIEYKKSDTKTKLLNRI